MLELTGKQLGNYRLERLLGQGGFAEVYLGRHVHLDTLAALKVLHLEMSERNKEQFRAEARLIAHLAHPSIVRVLDYGIEEQVPFLVMEYAPNGTLARRHRDGVPVPLKTVVSYVTQIAGALQYAHEKKIVHRDVKPENMLINERQAVLLSDFGIALITRSSGVKSTLGMAGTAAYMSPEQARGKPCPGSDQYSLGVVAYEWLCGKRPFYGSLTELCAQHLYEPPPSLRAEVPSIPATVEQVVHKALAKEPEARYASVLEFADALYERATGMRHLSSLSLPILTFSSAPDSTESNIRPPSIRTDFRRPEPAIEQQAQILEQAPSDTLSPPVPRKRRNHMVIPLVMLAFLIMGGSSGLFYFSKYLPDQQHLAARATQQRSTTTAWANATSTALAATSATGTALASANATATVQTAAKTPQGLYTWVTSQPPTVNDPLSSQSASDWDNTKNTNGSGCVFTAGALHLLTSPAQTVWYCVAKAMSYSDFALQVRITPVKGALLQTGVIFRLNYQSQKDYIFNITADGGYQLVLWNGHTNSGTYLSQGTSQFIHQGMGQSNLLMVIARGATIDLYVNAHNVAVLQDHAVGNGLVGFIALSAQGSSGDVVYTNDRFWDLATT